MIVITAGYSEHWIYAPTHSLGVKKGYGMKVVKRGGYLSNLFYSSDPEQ